MRQQARGRFDVSTTREPPYDSDDGVLLARTRFTKRFEGDMQATSTVEMLSAGSTNAPGSAGYVAMERVVGTLQGRRGGFVLQHSGTMEGGEGRLSCTVVPGTGTGELAGISGALSIRIEDGVHHYAFDYAVAPSGDAAT